MEIRRMRWGHDGGYGPDEGMNITEITVTGDDHHNYFVTYAAFNMGGQIYVSPVSLFDLLLEFGHNDVDSEYEIKKMSDLSIEEYSFAGDIPDEVWKSQFARIIEITEEAMIQYVKNTAQGENEAQAFINQYIDGKF